MTQTATTHGALVTLPEYFHLVTKTNKQEWIPVRAEDVPPETGLATERFERPTDEKSKPYVTPEDVASCWKKPGPAAGPFQARLGDGSVVTFYWYRFADQPALLNADLTDQEREAMQARVEKLHRNWTKDRAYLAPPPAGNLAVNSTGQGFPKTSASFSDRYGGIPKLAIDGRVIFSPTPVNRWTSYGSTNTSDWLEIDFGARTDFGRVDLYIFDDHGGVQAPASYTIQYFDNGQWRDVANQVNQPAKPVGSAINTATFSKATSAKARVVFTHRQPARSGVSELEIWPE